MKRVVVLLGGPSAERDVSLVSGKACADGLRQAGYDVREVDVGRDVGALIKALEPKPDVVFNALHGHFGEDGCIQGILNLLDLPYTHSGVLASALAMDKPTAKRVFAANNIRCPDGKVVDVDSLSRADPVPRPYVIKPPHEGSSVGVTIVRKGDNRALPTREQWQFGDSVLVERFIPGRELTVAVMGDRPLTVTELRPRNDFYDYEAKYTDGKTDHIIPAQVPKPVFDEALRLAKRAHEALGCRGISRSDFRYDDTEGGGPEKLYLLEVNTQPGMTPLSLAPEQAKWAGISWPQLMTWMVDNARRPT